MVACRSCGRNITSGVIRCAQCSTPFHLSCSHRYKISAEGVFNVCCGPSQSPFSSSPYQMRTRRNKRRQQNNINNLNNVNNNQDNNQITPVVATSSQDENMRYGKVMKVENVTVCDKPIINLDSSFDDEIQIIEDEYTNIENDGNVNQYENNGNDVIIDEPVNIQVENHSDTINNEMVNLNNDSNNKITLETVWQGIASLQTSISNISNSLDTVSTQLNTFDPRISELESSLNTIKTKTLNFENVQNDVSGLRDELTRITDELENLKSQQPEQQNIGISEILIEIKEREIKSRNILIYNVPEDNLRISQDYSTLEDINKFNELVAARDASRAREILGNVPNIDLDELETRRLGRSNPNICRPLRVSLSCREDVITVMKNRRFIDRQYTVKSDLTKFQQRRIKELKEELDKINVNKENPTMTIKFVNGEPKLMPIRRQFTKPE